MPESQEAIELFDQGCNCGQSMLGAFGPARGLNRDTALILGRPLGGGLGLSGGVCGAVSAAAMLLGWAAPAQGDEKAHRGQVFSLVREMLARFERRHGTILCGKLLGLELSRPEEQACFYELSMRASHCRSYMETASQLTAELLERVEQAPAGAAEA